MSLVGSSAAVVEGWRHATAQDSRALAGLDAELARARASDLWFTDAMQLRADWRLRVAGNAQLAHDALRMIDRALAVRAEPDLFMLRAEAAQRLSDSAAFVETARHAVQFLDATLTAAERRNTVLVPADLDMLGRRLAAWRSVFTETLGPAARDSSVYAEIDSALEHLRRYQTAAPRR